MKLSPKIYYTLKTTLLSILLLVVYFLIEGHAVRRSFSNFQFYFYGNSNSIIICFFKFELNNYMKLLGFSFNEGTISLRSEVNRCILRIVM